MDAPRMTAVFEYDLKTHPGNPFHTDTPFGRPLVLQLGDFSVDEAVELAADAAPMINTDLAAKPTIRDLLARAIDDLDAGQEVDLIGLERKCLDAALDGVDERAGEVLEGVTPGPWEAIATREIISPSGRTICRAHLDERTRTSAETTANARFIAWCREGVPALLAQNAALHQAVQHANDHANAAIEDMNAAEARAEALINGTGAASHMALDYIAKLEAAEAERDALRASLAKADDLADAVEAMDLPKLKADLGAAQELIAALRAERDAAKITQVWMAGEPPKHIRDEWFIAKTIHGDRVVLRALPEEWGYDYKTADETYMAAKNIAAWMQMPDSGYVSYAEGGAVTAEAVARADAAEAKAEKLRGALEVDADLLFDAYKGLLVLQKMLDVAGLKAGVEAADSLMERIETAHPEMPGRSAMRAALTTEADNG